MKFILTIFFSSLIAFNGFTQETQNKSVLMVSTKYFSEKCEYVAFRVSDKKIAIDNCFDFKTKNFTTTKTINLQEEPVIEKIYNMPTQNLKNYEMEINAIQCDYIAPIFIFVTEGEKTTQIEWKGIHNCYPKTLKTTIEKLEKVFKKYK